MTAGNLAQPQIVIAPEVPVMEWTRETDAQTSSPVKFGTRLNTRKEGDLLFGQDAGRDILGKFDWIRRKSGCLPPFDIKPQNPRAHWDTLEGLIA